MLIRSSCSKYFLWSSQNSTKQIQVSQGPKGDKSFQMFSLKPLIFASFTLFSLSKPAKSLASVEDHRKIQSFSLPNRCNEKCGSFHVPFPFHLNASCFSVPDAFRLSCANSTTLFLQIGDERYKVVEFFTDGLLVDFPSASVCREYQNLKSFSFAGNGYFGISADNVVGLYDCEDSSLCRADCETNDLPGCNGNDGGSVACCYPLSDHSVWAFGDEFSVFSKFGCRGFSSWVVPRGSNSGKRGVKLEWAIPSNISVGVCAENANVVNATAVGDGVRCSCEEGYVGDGFSNGVGCLKSCIKNGEEAYGRDCDSQNQGERKLVIVAGVLAPFFVLASLAGLCCLLKRPVKGGRFSSSQANYHSSISFRKACRTRLFSYQELEEATKGFGDGQKLADGKNGVIHVGVLADGSHVAVHKVECNNERGLIQILSKIELLSAVLHRNLARVLGCCVDCGYAAMVVYEYPRNGTLEEHLHPSKRHNLGLDWCKKLKIAAETASILAYLQCEIIPPIYHPELKTCYIFLDEDSSARVAGFSLIQDGPVSCHSFDNPHMHNTDVYDFGVILLEMISGCKQETPKLTLQKIRSGKLEEVLDPSLYYHEQPIFRREQIEIVADIATRCMLFGGDGKMSMSDVARELVHMVKESVDGCSKRDPALQETFSNSSLLQMISMSPDSIHVP